MTATRGKGDDEAVANISRKVARTARACKSLGRWAFWSQLVLTTVAAVIVVFSFLYKGLTKSTDAGLYFILFGLVAGYFTTFWSLGVVRLGDKLRKGAKDLDVVPPRTDVIRTLSDGGDRERDRTRCHHRRLASDDGHALRQDAHRGGADAHVRRPGRGHGRRLGHLLSPSRV